MLTAGASATEAESACRSYEWTTPDSASGSPALATPTAAQLCQCSGDRMLVKRVDRTKAPAGSWRRAIPPAPCRCIEGYRRKSGGVSFPSASTAAQRTPSAEDVKSADDQPEESSTALGCSQRALRISASLQQISVPSSAEYLQRGYLKLAGQDDGVRRKSLAEAMVPTRKYCPGRDAQELTPQQAAPGVSAARFTRRSACAVEPPQWATELCRWRSCPRGSAPRGEIEGARACADRV